MTKDVCSQLSEINRFTDSSKPLALKFALKFSSLRSSFYLKMSSSTTNPPTTGTSTTTGIPTATSAQTTWESALQACGLAQLEMTALVEVGGIRDYGDMMHLKDSDIDDLARQVRKTKNPNAAAGANPNYIFSFMAEKNLKLLLSEIKLRDETCRRVDQIYKMVPDDLVRFRSRKDEKAAFKDPKEGKPEAAVIAKNWVKGFEMLDQWIGSHVDSVTNLPLAFMIREEQPDRSRYDSSRYVSLADELAKRCEVWDVARVLKPWSTRCSSKVWDLLYSIFQDHAAYQYMKPFKRARDGRGAYFALRDHYLGPNNVNNMATDLESQFESLSYTQETRRWNFEKYVNKHVELYNIAEDLKLHGYSGMDETSRVRKLVNGIKTDKLDSVKTRIMSDPDIMKDFDRATSLFKDFIAQRKSLLGPSASQIAGVTTNKQASNNGDGSRKGKGKRKAQTAGVEIKDRYYSPKEYAQLSSEEKNQLRELRNKRRRTDGDDKGKQTWQAQIKSLNTQMQALVASVGGHDDDGTNNGSGDSTVQTNNRTNPALTRQPGNGNSRE